MNTLSGRSGSIDLTKCMATCAVLMIHCSANRYQLFTVGSLDWLTVLFWNGTCKWAVPVFLMCSGALMNDPQRELPLNRLFSRYLLRLVASLSVWAALYECLRILILRGSAPLSELLWAAGKNWFTGNTYYHLYYFYFAIGLYLALPLTRLITRWASKQELRYLLLLWLFFGSVLPCLQYFLPFRLTGPSLLRFILSPVFASAGLGLLGWYLHQKPAGRLLPSLLLFLAGFAALFFFTWQHSDAEKNLNIILLDGFSPAAILMGVAVFRIAQTLAEGRSLPSFISFLSRGSFCVYLIHPFFQLVTRERFWEALPPLWGTPLQAALLLVLSLAAYWVLRKIPLVSRWLI